MKWSSCLLFDHQWWTSKSSIRSCELFVAHLTAGHPTGWAQQIRSAGLKSWRPVRDQNTFRDAETKKWVWVATFSLICNLVLQKNNNPEVTVLRSTLENERHRCSHLNKKRLTFPQFGCSSVKQTLICRPSLLPAQSDAIKRDVWQPQRRRAVQAATAQTTGCQQHFDCSELHKNWLKYKTFFFLLWVDPHCYLSFMPCDLMWVPVTKDYPSIIFFYVRIAIVFPW